MPACMVVDQRLWWRCEWCWRCCCRQNVQAQRMLRRGSGDQSFDGVEEGGVTHRLRRSERVAGNLTHTHAHHADAAAANTHSVRSWRGRPATTASVAAMQSASAKPNENTRPPSARTSPHVASPRASTLPGSGLLCSGWSLPSSWRGGAASKRTPCLMRGERVSERHR